MRACAVACSLAQCEAALPVEIGTMTTLDTPSPDDLPDTVHAAFERLTGANRMPPLYRQIGNSAEALGAYLNAELAIANGVLTPADIETVKLAVSVHNACAFCVKTHTAKAQAACIGPADVEAMLAGRSPADARLAAVYGVCAQLLSGTELGAAERSTAESAGIDQAGLVEIGLAMATISFTNWFNHINHTPA